jgi:cystathionine beta-lyase/cystathionine gamma-synthase
VPLEAGATDAAVFNTGMAAIMTAFFAVVRPRTTDRLHHAALRRHHRADPLSEAVRRGWHSVRSGDAEALDAAIRSARNCSIVLLETPANPTLIMTDIERAAESAARHPDKPVVMVDNTFLGPSVPASAAVGRRCLALFRHQVSLRLQRHAGGRGAHQERGN